MLTIAGAEQHELHQVAVLAQERVPARLLRLLGELVRPVLRARRFSTSARGQAGPRVDAERLQASSAVEACATPGLEPSLSRPSQSRSSRRASSPSCVAA